MGGGLLGAPALEATQCRCGRSAAGRSRHRRLRGGAGSDAVRHCSPRFADGPVARLRYCLVSRYYFDRGRDGPAVEHRATSSHLGDFTAIARMLLIAALALPVGAVSAGVAWALLRLIGLITNAVFYGRVGHARWSRPAPGTTTRLVVLLAPVAGGLVIGAHGPLRVGEDPRSRHAGGDRGDPARRQQGAAAGRRAQTGLGRGRDRHRRPVRRRGPDHHDRRRGRVRCSRSSCA